MMHQPDYEILAEAVRNGVAAAEDEAQPAGTLAGMTVEQVRQVAALLVAGITDHLADRLHNFNPDVWLPACGMSAEVAAMRPTVREVGEPLAFDDARPGDWIRYANRPGQPIVGRIHRRTDLTVWTADERSLVSGAQWPSGHELRRSRWGRLHVTLIDPTWVLGEAPSEAELTPPTRRRLPREEATRRAWEAARAYLAREGHLRVPAVHVEDGYRLGGWISSQRYDYRHHCLNPDRLRELDALHVSWRDGIPDGGAKA